MKNGFMAICITVMTLNSVYGENLVDNSDFESVPPVEVDKSVWSFDGTASHSNWRSNNGGKYCAGIGGLWAERGGKGSVSQGGIPVKKNTTYILKPCLYADMDWRPRRQFMFVEYYGDESEKMLTRKELVFSQIYPVFTDKDELVTVSPSNAVYATVGVAVHGVSGHGGLTVDNIYFGTADEESDE